MDRGFKQEGHEEEVDELSEPMYVLYLCRKGSEIFYLKAWLSQRSREYCMHLGR